MPSTSDPAAPSIKSLELVRNKNNVAELELRRRLEKYDREQSVSITNLDIEKIDVTDFLKGVKKIHSDDLLESRMWLRTGKDAIGRRDIFTAPPGGCRTQPEETAPEEESNTSEAEQDEGDDLLRRLKATSQVTMAIFSKRNMYSSLERKVLRPLWPGMENRFTESGQVIRGVKFEDSWGGGGGGGGVSRSATPSLRTGTPNTISRLDSTPSRTDTPESKKPSTPGSKKSRDRDRSRDRNRDRSRDRHHRGGGKGDFMKDLLESNAKRRYKKDKDPPLEDRITDFFSKIDKKYDGIQELSAEEKKRQWMRLIKGGPEEGKAKRKSRDDGAAGDKERSKDNDPEGGKITERSKNMDKKFGSKSEAAKDDIARGGL